jgi:GntR family transcriptional regulator / MocR family aminotransferase
MRAGSPELFVRLDRQRRRGLRAQLEVELRDTVRSGRLGPGTLLPSSRALADDLGVSRSLVVAVYEQLTAEGYLVGRRGSGTVVADRATPAPSPTAVPARGPTGGPGRPHPAAAAASAEAPGAPRRLSFTPAHPDLRLFPRRAWARAFRASWSTLPDDALGLDHPLGLPALRAALADYLRRVRGVACEPDQVVVCGGLGQGFELVARLLAEQLGHTTIGCEDPGDPYLDAVLRRQGLTPIPVPVDDDGLQVDRLEATGTRAVVLTPANQFPLGMVLSAERRRRLGDWARRHDGYILEDDCEAEFRHHRPPTGALQGLAPDRVVYFGATWQSLAPGLRLGWFVLPPTLLEVFERSGAVAVGLASPILEATFAEFLAHGDLDRHLRMVRRAYARRRAQLVAALERGFPGARTTGVAAGLHVTVLLPDGVDAGHLATMARDRGVDVEVLADFRSGADTADRADGPDGLVLGYASLTPAQIDDGIATLAAIARSQATH